MNPTYQISEAEWQVMQCLWRKSPLEIKDLLTMLQDKTGWSANMIRTLVVRLQEKGAVGAEKTSRIYRYYPIAQEQECVQQETQSFLNRVFDGSPVKMIAALTGSGKLTKEDCAEIEAMLQQMKERE
jgi:BlaI family penicillinase repressor